MNNRIIKPTKKEERIYRKWLALRPDKVRVIAEKFDPWSLYRMKSTGHRVVIHSFYESENGNVMLTVQVFGDHNMLLFERNVFGVDPDDLELCEPPDPHEPVGTLMDQDEAREFLKSMKVK